MAGQGAVASGVRSLRSVCGRALRGAGALRELDVRVVLEVDAVAGCCEGGEPGGADERGLESVPSGPRRESPSLRWSQASVMSSQVSIGRGVLVMSEGGMYG